MELSDAGGILSSFLGDNLQKMKAASHTAI